MQQKGPRYKTEAFTLWLRLCLYLRLRYKLSRGGAGSNPPLQFGDYDYFDACFDVAVDLDWHLVRTEGLYGVFEADTAPVQTDTARLLDRVRYVGGRDGTEESLVLAGTGLDGNYALVQDVGDLLSPLGQAPVPLLRLLHRAAGFLELAWRRHLGQSARDQEVAHVTAAHIHDVAALPDLLDVPSQYYLQGTYLPTT